MSEPVVIPISKKVSEKIWIRRKCYRLAIEILERGT